MSFEFGREFDDYTAARSNVYNQFAEAASQLKPVEFGGRRLEIADVSYDAADEDVEGSERYDFKSQSNAVRGKTTLGRRLRGTVRMSDINTGEVLEEKRSLLAVVPRVNEDGTMIYRGARYNVVNQQRMKPAVYGRVKKNAELESYVNAKQGTGSMHRYIFNPESSVFYVNVGNSRIPLVPLLRTLGVGDDDIRSAWGDEIASKNFAKKSPDAIDKLYERLVPKGLKVDKADPETKRDAIRLAIAKIEVDPWSMKRISGVETSSLTPETILAATRKTLDMSRGSEDGDDRDHLAFQTVHSIEDMFSERVKGDAGREHYKAARKALARSKLSALPPKLLQKHIESTIFGSGLGVMPENANPLDAWDRSTRITKLGDGGIGSVDAVPLESRDYHISHAGFIDPSRTVESLKVGIDTNLASRVVKGKDGKVYSPFVNARTGQMEYLTAEEITEKNLAFSDEEIVPGYFLYNRNGKEDYARRDQIDYFLPHAETAFSSLSNLIPMKGLQPQNRTAMGTRFLTQSLPLVNREAPLVQVAVPGTEKQLSFEKLYAGRVGAVTSKFTGKVEDVSPDYVVINDGESRHRMPLHNGTPLGRKSALRNKLLVSKGQQVEAGQVLASSNFTDDSGTMAMGLNARMAIMPWRDNYEDAYTVSESFAKRMASDASYDYRRESDPESKTKLNDFVSVLPRAYTKDQLKVLDEDGVITVGSVVGHGDPLVLSARQRSVNKAKKLTRSGQRPFMDSSQTWDHEDPGVVREVFRDKRGGVVVTVDSKPVMKSGDKIAELFGSKGIVRIVPDDDMVADLDGKPFDIVSSDLGFISRKNSSRALSIMLGKVAQKTGKPYLLEEMEPGADLASFVESELKKHNVSDTETVVDPTNGRKIKGVLAGPQYVLKLQHTSESKSQGRGSGAGTAYASDGQPAKGSEEGMQAKRLSNQELGALVSHGAFEYLREAALVRGQRNDEYVARFINGHDAPPPTVPLVYEKFLGYLKGMGVNPVRTGSKTKLFLMGNKEVEELAEGRELKNAETVNMAKDMEPVAGGLFDESIFGEGDKFASYKLSEPIPHPLMEDAFRTLMGVTKDKFRNILAGREEYGELGTGTAAISAWASKLDPARELKLARQQAKSASKTKRESAIKRVRFLAGMVNQGIKPENLLIDRVPIIPPRFRPVSKLEGKDTPLIDGMNLLYREMLTADQNLRDMKGFSSDVSNERLSVYDTVQAAVGLRQPLDPELRQKSVTGIMKRLVGKGGPKTSYVSQKLLSGTVDNVGRAVAAPDSTLGLDEVGIPEEQAWRVFEPALLRNLRRRGVDLATAKKAVSDRTEAARVALLEEMEHRPVTVSRAPVLHKYGKLAFMPKLIKGETIHMNPLIHAGYALDHDGDLQISTVVVALPVRTYFNDFDLNTKKALEKFYAKVRMGVSNAPSSVSERETMASFSKASLPFCQDHDVFQVDLEDFPHLDEKERTSQGRCGDIHWYKAIPGTKVLAVNPKDGGIEWAPVTRWTEHHGCPVEIVHLSNGYAIYTDDDPRAVLGVDPNISLSLITATPTQAKANGMLVPRAVKVECDFAVGSIDTTVFQNLSRRSGLALKDTVDLDANAGWLIGAHASDGWPTGSGICLSKLNVSVREKWLRCLSAFTDSTNLNHKEYHRTKEEAKSKGSGFGESKRFYVGSREFSVLFTALCGDGALNKHLPPWFLSTSPEFRIGMLCGLFDTDAGISVTRAKGKKPQLRTSITSVSLRLLREIALLSMSLGLQAKISFSKVTSANNTAWILEWRSGEVQAFIKQHKKHMVDKDRTRMAIETPVDTLSGPYVRKEKLVITKALAKAIRTKIGMPKNRRTVTQQHKSAYDALCQAVLRGYMSRESAKLIPIFVERDWIKQQPDGATFLRYLDDETIVWEYIEDVEITGQPHVGYDLTVPGYENWMTVDGVFVPNTLNFHALITEDAIEEAKNKLLPSKSLISPTDFKSPMFVPRQDHALGIYLASSQDRGNRPVKFANARSAMLAFKRGEIDAGTRIEIVGD